MQITQVVSSKGGKVTVLADDGKQYTLSGNVAWRGNNPGNIRPPGSGNPNYLGAVGVMDTGSNGKFLVFPDRAAGLAAQEHLQFESSGYKDKTIAQAIAKYAPSGDNNNPADYAARVAAAAGVPVTTKMSDLTPTQRAAYMAAQHQVENNTAGHIVGPDGSAVDAMAFAGSAPANINNPALNAIDSATAQQALLGNQPAAAAPKPMPGRPAAITGPQAAATKAATAAGKPPPVKLPSGQWVSPGTYPSSNDGHTFTVNPDGTITHNLNPGEIPGLIDPLHEPQGTIAGGIVQQTIRDMAAKAAQDAAPAVTAGAQSAVTAASNEIQAAPGQVLNYFGNLFKGGNTPAAAPVNALAPGVGVNGGSPGAPISAALTGVGGEHFASSTPRSGGTPAGADVVGAGGNFAALQNALASVKNYKPTTTYTTQQMTAANPDYLKYIAAQKADPIGAGPGSFGSLTNALATTAGAAPPRTITTSQQVAHQAPDEALRATQQTLAQAGYYTGAIDGLYGPKTAAAIAAANAAHPAAAAPVNALAPKPVAAPAPRLTPDQVANVAYGSGGHGSQGSPSAQGWGGF